MKMFRKILPALRSNLCSGSVISVPQSSEGVVKNVLLGRAAATTKSYHTSPVLGDLFKDSGKQRAIFKKAKTERALTINEAALDQNDEVTSKYPTSKSPFMLFGGVMFKDLHIVNIWAGSNNTKISVADQNGKVELIRTCGTEGYKNARKATTVAAQATSYNIGKKMVLRGIKNVRVCLSGIGLGRETSLKGLMQAGVNIVSLTDTTPISYNPPRPKKQRRL